MSSPYNNEAQPVSENNEQPKKKKKGGCLKWGAIILGIIIVIAIISNMSGGGDDSNDNGTDSSTVEQNDKDKNQNNDEEAPLAIGDTYTTEDGLDVTVNEIHPFTDVFGDNYLAAEVSYQNNGDKEAKFDMLDWETQTPAGVVTNSTISGENGALDSGKLTPGGTVSGTVYFDGGEPGEHHITWSPSFSFSSDKATWVGNI